MGRKRVISFKVDEEQYHELEKAARVEGVTLSRYCEKIVDSHLNFFSDFKRLRLVALPRPFVAALFESLDKNKVKEVEKMGILNAMNLLKTELPSMTYNNVTRYIEQWFHNSSITFNYFPDEDNEKSGKYACRHGLGENWACIMIKIVSHLLKKVNCVIKKTEYDEHVFEIKFIQKK